MHGSLLPWRPSGGDVCPCLPLFCLGSVLHQLSLLQHIHPSSQLVLPLRKAGCIRDYPLCVGVLQPSRATLGALRVHRSAVHSRRGSALSLGPNMSLNHKTTYHWAQNGSGTSAVCSALRSGPPLHYVVIHGAPVASAGPRWRCACPSFETPCGPPTQEPRSVAQRDMHAQGMLD